MVLSPALNIRSARGPIYDADALAFCRASGATARKAISDFVKGVKALGLWNNMVCWPLRSSQNAGTGDTVYSLGGLGTFNGTRVNGPAWTADGITTDDTNETISLPASSSLAQIRSGLAAFKTTSNALNQRNGRYVDTGGVGTGVYWQLSFDGQRFANQYGGPKPIFTRNGVQSENFDPSGSRAINLSQFQTNAFTADDSTDNAFVNGALATNGARTGLSAINPTGTANARELLAASSGMTQAAVLLSTQKWSNAQVLALHNLYRATLGTGLGLP